MSAKLINKWLIIHDGEEFASGQITSVINNDYFLIRIDAPKECPQPMKLLFIGDLAHDEYTIFDSEEELRDFILWCDKKPDHLWCGKKPDHKFKLINLKDDKPDA